MSVAPFSAARGQRAQTGHGSNETNPTSFCVLAGALLLMIVNYRQVTLQEINGPLLAETIKAIKLMQQEAESKFCWAALSVAEILHLRPLSPHSYSRLFEREFYKYVGGHFLKLICVFWGSAGVLAAWSFL